MGNYQNQQILPEVSFEEKGKELNVRGKVRSITDYLQYIQSKSKRINTESQIALPIPETLSLYERLNASFNSLTEIQLNMPFIFPHLTYLDLSHNNLYFLPDTMGLFLHLEILILHHNYLKQIPHSMVQLDKLSKLDLSNNMLITLPKSLGEMKSLQKLNISHNKIRELPLSLIECSSLRLILACDNLMENPPQNICDRGSKPILDYFKQKRLDGLSNQKPPKSNFKFPRQQWNHSPTNVPNPDSPQMKYIQMQTHTTYVPSRLKTPLHFPPNSTKLDAHVLSDKITGLIYGAAVGDAIGLAARWMDPDECQFYYDKDLKYCNIRQDKHRVFWSPGDWTSNFDTMVLVLDSLIAWAGVIDELDFSKRLKYWSKHGFPELNDTKGTVPSFTIQEVLKQQSFEDDPHLAAEAVLQEGYLQDPINSTTENCTLDPCLITPPDEYFFNDNSAVVRAAILGIPYFYNLSEVANNSVRICRSSHNHPECIASCIAITVIIALLLQGSHDLNNMGSVRALLNTSAFHANPYLKTDEQNNEFESVLSVTSLKSLNIREERKMTHTYKPLGCAALAVKTTKGYREFISDLVLEGGDSASNACVAGAILGCRLGYLQLPSDWLTELLPQQVSWLNVKVNSLLDMLGLP
ncbi:uncharacterized protein LOC106880302 isoform X1 [Octopus bimaculoides]|uniref:Uncharacterized protein n=1 Tax=Octopus bimaculoides TaxID=37653 RepID=A0A0L8FZU8_OCTBM|nr:uncharacterized protein LOC106880302 isoform X1 [Octopus bimaculoides]|eukprot:XP_014785659.1 PREDICTED: uncharacterized protein LOC106880302 isoform X1 [Octopus bimaculoides]